MTGTLPFPRYIRYSGAVPQVGDAPGARTIGISFVLYEQQRGGVPLWTEFHNVHVSADGRYSVLLGSLHEDGVDERAFSANEARWLGVEPQGQQELPRTLLVSVPYAIKASEADSLSAVGTAALLDTMRAHFRSESLATTTTSSRASASTEFSAATASSAYTDNNGTEVVLVQQTGSGYGLRSLSSTLPAIWAESPGTVWAALVGNATSTTQPGIGAIGMSAGVGGYGVIGRATARGGIGVRGDSNSSGGIGVYGVVTATTGAGVGITGETEADQGIGLFGRANSATGTTYGILGASASNSGIGLRGNATHTQGNTIGVYATVFSPNGTAAVIENVAGGKLLSATTNGVEKAAIDGSGNVTANSLSLKSGSGVTFADGTKQTSAAATSGAVLVGTAITGVLSASQSTSGSTAPISEALPPAGFHGIATSPSGSVAGVVGESASPDGYGVTGVNTAPTGNAYGVAGFSMNAPLGVGVYGEASSSDPAAAPTGVFGWVTSSSAGTTGVAGEAAATAGDTTGVYGAALSTSGYGVEGDAFASTGVAIGVAGFSDSDQGRGVLGSSTSSSGQTFGVRGLSESDQGTGVAGLSFSPSGNTVGISGEVASATGVAAVFTNTSGAGDLLVGRIGPGANVFRVDANGKGYFNNGTQVSGADFAEMFAVRGGKDLYAPGDLLAIDATSSRRLKPADEPYSKLVAGVYSTKPGITAQPYSIGNGQAKSEIPLAVIGVVELKVTAANGPIRPGDLLVASAFRGRAMKGTDGDRMLGAIVGKALEPWAEGEGTIQVLVTLQ